MDRSQLLRKVDVAWQQFKLSCAGLSDPELLEPGVAGIWSVKDIIAHVTCWEAEALKHLPTVLAGKRPPKYSDVYGGIDAFNARMMDQIGKLSLTEVMAQRDDTHERLIGYLLTVPEEHLRSGTRFQRRLRLDTYGHYQKHTEAILRWRGNKSDDR